MNFKFMLDLIVVGGSAVGLFLAKEFSKKGKSVLVLEKKKKIGGKICSGLVSFNILDFVKEKDLPLFLEKEIKSANLWIEKKKFSFPGKALLFDRDKFDFYLFEKAKEAGAKILLEKNVIKIEEKRNFVDVQVSSGEFFRSKFVAGCDGAVSLVANRLSLPSQKRLLLGVITYQEKKLDEKFVDLFFSKKFPGFFLWRIPRKDKVEWGIALKPSQKPKEKLEEFLNKKNIFPKKFFAALIPYFPLKKTVSKRVFLCGDSAGHIKPYTGGGLIYGFKCAKIAAECLFDLKPSSLLEYEKRWRKELMSEIYLGEFLRKCYFLPNIIKKTGLKILQKRKRLDQDKPSSIFRF